MRGVGSQERAIALVLFASLTNWTAPALAQNPFQNISGTQRLLIIAPNEFMSALQPLVQHKNQSGLGAMAISISSLSPYFKGVDDPETVKHAIQYAHEHLGTQYIMLVGDAQKFPVRYQFMHNLSIYYPFSQQLSDQSWSVPSNWLNAAPNNLSPTGYSIAARPIMDASSGVADGSYLPSDLYYANLYHHPLPFNGTTGAFDNWDANGNGEYNEGTWVDPANLNPDNVDGIPDVAVGRVPAHTAADVQAYVNKIISYESSSPQVKFTFIGDYAYEPPTQNGAFSGSVSDTQQVFQNSGLANNPATANSIFALIEIPPPPPPPPLQPGQTIVVSVPPNWLMASPDDVANYAKQSTWVSYIGHGSNQSWGADGVFAAANVAETAQNSILPVVFSAGCSTGSFINEPPWNQAYSDISGTAHDFDVASPAPSANAPDVPIIIDADNGELWGGPSGPNVNSLPLTVPKPNPYDGIDNRMDQSFAYSWLIGNAPGGAIVYFGETGVSNPLMAMELETDLLQNYLTTPNPVLGDIYLTAEQRYAVAHQNDVGYDDSDFHSIPRFYLGWMMLFGDPSLRLPNLTTASTLPQVTSVTPSSGTNLGGTQVKIKGANFSWPGGTQITFATVPATAVTCSSDSECAASSPAYKEGAAAYTVDVQAVVSPVGVQSTAKTLTSPANPKDHFTYPAGPKCYWTLTCPEPEATYPALDVKCSSMVNFVDVLGKKSSGASHVFTTSGDHVVVLACDPATGSCVSHSIYQPKDIFCREPTDLCDRCKKSGGTCSGPNAPQVCTMQ
jgi:Peptidase family C25/IPT/TIG domain